MGKRFLATALKDCYDASETFSSILDEPSKAFYQRFDLAELLGYPTQLHLAFTLLKRMTKWQR